MVKQCKSNYTAQIGLKLVFKNLIKNNRTEHSRCGFLIYHWINPTFFMTFRSVLFER